jgi:hypothetical protein
MQSERMFSTPLVCCVRFSAYVMVPVLSRPELPQKSLAASSNFAAGMPHTLSTISTV